ncbi:hypothetical protein [Dictyobacter arantiisoli]|uniref:Tetratricopeptide repeat protein n=1 Tax=Dictyobacter arantiisoli TaxID=2014874 RepID=A0A5A5THG8_9CHLR|nr:hypothetical protein [Dictyobacter arantiisoli]GCF11021.1 hypothetical protein KDI_45850 [Dictyobacter arantiisoli]
MKNYSEQTALPDMETFTSEFLAQSQLTDELVVVGTARYKKTLAFIKYALLLDAIDEGWLYEQQGWMFNQLHRYREAVEAFDRARRLGYANDGWLYKQKSYALNKLERNEEALEAGERARKLGYVNEE